MKTEILTELEKLLETDNIFTVQQKFKALSRQFKSLIEHNPFDEEEDTEEEDPDEAHFASESVAGSKSAEAAPKQENPAGGDPGEAVEKSGPANGSDDVDSNGREDNIGSSVNQTETGAEIKTSETPASGSETQPVESEIRTESDTDKPEPAQADSDATEQMPAQDSESIEEAYKHFRSLQEKFEERLTRERAERKRIEEETLQTAKDLLDELRKLVENEENIGKAFNGFNAIQEKWKSLPRVSNDSYRDLNAEYNKYAEQFFYNINIYKELKELDLKHNLEQKLAVIEDQKRLLELNDIRRMEVEVRLNQDRWNEIGPTFKEKWEEIKDEFWSVTRQIYKRIQDFYMERRAEQDKNLAAKEQLIKQLDTILALNLKSFNTWQQKTEDVIELQKQWKMIGPVAKEKSGVWKTFRSKCDTFFENKREYLNNLRAVQNAHRDAKLALIEKAESIKDSTDWKKTSSELKNFQKEWKKIGGASPRDERKLWSRFRAACDHFFQNMKAQQKEAQSEHVENLKAKNALLERMKAFNPGDNPTENVQKLKEFAGEWRAIGHVPFKDKDEVNRAYKKILDEKYKALKIDKKQKEKIRFEQKLEDLKEKDGNQGSLRREQDSLRGRISALKSERIQLENNMGFFANSKGAEKFKNEIERKVEKINEEIADLKERLKMLRNV